MDLSAADLPTLQQWQQQALQAYAQTQSTGRVTSVSYSQGDGSRSVSYSTGDVVQMRAWLASLAAEIARRTGVFRRPTRRAIGIRF